MKYFYTLALILNSIFASPQKQVAITFDDLPIALPKISLKHTLETNKKILQQLHQYQVPAIGFVNESQIDIWGEKDERLNILRMWAEQGLELGNHTYSHRDYHSTSFEDYVADIEKGETYTRLVLQEKNKVIRFFRPPFLNLGKTLEEKEKLEAHLSQQGYTIAPSSIETSDFIFNLIYLKAQANQDSSLMKSTIKDYLAFTALRIEYYESIAREITGPEPLPQIFLCHINALNADCLDQLLELFRSKNYEFISLDEALQHPIYNTTNTYTGSSGISWLHRWNTQYREKNLMNEPQVNDHTISLYSEIEEKQFWALLKPRLLGLETRLIYVSAGVLLTLILLSLLLIGLKGIKRAPLISKPNTNKV